VKKAVLAFMLVLAMTSAIPSEAKAKPVPTPTPKVIDIYDTCQGDPLCERPEVPYDPGLE